MPTFPEVPLFPAGCAGHFQTRDFDEMAALPAEWKQEYRQIEPGAFSGSLTIAHTARTQLGHVIYGRGISVDGLPPAGSCTLMLFMDGLPDLHIRGRPVQPTDFVALMPSDEIEAVARRAVSLLSTSVHAESLQGYVETVCGKPLSAFIESSRCAIQRDPAALAANWRGLLQWAQSRPARLADPAQARFFDEALLAGITESLALPSCRVPSHKRQELARKARAYLHEHALEPLLLSDLCRAVGAPERTLYLAFQESFGMSPKAYLKTLRLNGARRALRQAGPGDSVSGIAARWGFLHFGWFSVDYHKLFGERPSDTLARAIAAAN